MSEEWLRAEYERNPSVAILTALRNRELMREVWEEERRNRRRVLCVAVALIVVVGIVALVLC